MYKSTLRATTALQAFALFGMGLSAPAFAQDAPPPPPPTTAIPAPTDSIDVPKPVTDATDDAEVAAEGGTIVVTGTIFRRTTAETPSPVTVVTAEALEKRGTNTIQEGLQNLSSNNGPALTNSFSANGAFAAGASAVSLRGLSTNSTLVLFDGMRAAYYPLADDGSRNFVDLNTIPDDIVERVEILRDGASSSYGADAIAGVVNIITKREFQGIQARAEAGVSSRGDAQQKRFSLTAGIGDIQDKGFNAYVSGFYYKSDGLLARDRPYPFGTDDLRQVCDDGNCGPNNIINGVGATGFGVATPFAIRPRTPNGTPNGAAVVGGTRYTYLNGCGNFATNQLTPAQLATNPFAVAPADGVVCQEDLTNLYGNISPDIERFGISARGTFTVGDSAEVYAEANFISSQVSFSGIPASVRANAPTGIFFPRFSTAAGGGINAPGSAPLALPIYVCPNNVAAVGTANGTNPTCTAVTPGAILNPYNPYAAAGQVAQILGRLPNLNEYSETRNRAIRGAIGVKGSFLSDFNYQVDATAMKVDLRRTQTGYVRIQNFLDAIVRNQYNFLNPSATPDSVMDQIAPENITKAESDLYQVQGTVTKDLMQLPGGPLQLGVGASWRHESVDAPSANSDINGPTQRYFRINAFGTSGSRNVWSAYGELNAPIFDMLEVNLSGRYDKYSTGQKAFSPKAGVKFTPIRELALRGTWSKGFRIPSFAEANALPTTGFVTANSGIYTNAFLSQYGAGCTVATFTTGCPAYLVNTAYGLTTLASPDLKPEKSRSFTFGAIFEPIRNWAVTIDYYDIKKTGAITTPNTSLAIAAYYASADPNAPIPAGFTVVGDAPDPNFPNAKPRIAFVESQLINSNTIRSRGIDFALAGRANLGPVRWTTGLEASYIIELSTSFPDGSTENYPGTLGNFNLTAGSGTPRWKGSWQNGFEIGKLNLVGTVNYFGGYNLSAEDQTGPNSAGECGLSSGYTPCDVKRYITLDMVAQFKLNDQFTLTGTVLNVFDKLPPIDPVTYGAHLYNPVQGGTGIFGRYFRAGVKVNL